MSSQTSKELGQVLKKIPLFQGLSPTQIRAILGISKLQSYKHKEQICEGGDKASDEVYILLSGQLAVKTADGVRVATVIPVTTVGEIALIAKQQRTATVEAVMSSRVLVVPKPKFDLMLRNNKDMQVTIYRNVIEILFTKLTNDNVRMRDHLLEKVRRETRIKEERRRTEIALDLLEEKGGVNRDEAESHIAAATKNISLQILIADDEPAVRSVVKEALASFEVMEASNGREALEAIRENPPDLVIADIKMPEMDGRTLLTHLRDKYPDLPVLGLSGMVEIDEIENFGFDGFVEKPIQLEAFRKLVEETLVKDG